MRRFLDLADLSREEVLQLLALAERLQRQPEPQALAGKILGLLFLNPSLRTLASFQAGMARLGGSSFVITPGQGHLAARDAARCRNGWGGGRARARGHPRSGLLLRRARHPRVRRGRDLAADLAETTFTALAALVEKPLINLESAVNHPCQALADWKTLEDLGVPQRGRFVLSWAYHPRPLPLAVPSAVLHMAALRGMEVVVLRPEGYALPEPVMAKARRAAALSGGSVRESEERREALAGAQVLYAKEWGATACYGDAAEESRRRAGLADWCVREEWFETAEPGCRLMHCLPVRRNVAVADEVLDGPRSVVRHEAYNRLPVQMAVLYRLLKDL